MKRRSFVIGAAGAAGAAFLLKPRDQGGPYPDYFAALNRSLREDGPGRAAMVIDRDRLLENCRKVRARLPPGKAFRVVAKSLASLPLLKVVLDAMGTDRLMVFHQPHLNLLAEAFPASDLLLGKPMPVAAAHTFYTKLKSPAGASPQWLIDSPGRLNEYAGLAKALGKKLRVSLEIDVGLHRGGARTPAELQAMLQLLDPARLELSGLMGYDAHVGKIPALVESRAKSFEKACAAYRSMQAVLPPGTFTLNGAGSPTLRLHGADSPANELAAGSCFVKPADFDVETLADLEPAAFIAAPVLKALDGTAIPGIETASGLIPRWDANRQRTFFVYGGRWQARWESPPGLEDNPLYGKSSNQAMVNGSRKVTLTPGDHVFLRPAQSERVLQELGDLLVVSNGKLVDSWPALPP